MRLPNYEHTCPICAPVLSFKTHGLLRYHLLDVHKKVWEEKSQRKRVMHTVRIDRP